MVSKKVIENIETYFKEHLSQYTILEVRRKSIFPEDSYLYMISAIREDGVFAVWTSWNETTQCLNHGHYDLENIEDCEKVFEEYYNRG